MSEVLKYKYEINLDLNITCSGCGKYIPMGFWISHSFCIECKTHRYYCDGVECRDMDSDICKSCNRDRKLGDILDD